MPPRVKLPRQFFFWVVRSKRKQSFVSPPLLLFENNGLGIPLLHISHS